MIVVTGAAGFIGKHLLRWLLKHSPANVVGLDNLARGRWEGLEAHGRLRTVTCDLLDRQTLEEVFAGADSVFHLAAQANVMGAVADVDNSFSSNVIGTYYVLRAAQRVGVRHVVFTSSREVYGEPSHLPVSETFPLIAKNAYGASKIACEAYCRVFDNAKMRVSIVRLTNVYGPGDWDRVIPIFIERALNGLPLVIQGGQKVIDFVPLAMVVEALWRVLDHPPGEPINIGSGRGTPLTTLAERILRETGSRSEIQFTPGYPAEVVRFAADITRMQTGLGLQPPEDPLMYLPEQVAAMARPALRLESTEAPPFDREGLPREQNSECQGIA